MPEVKKRYVLSSESVTEGHPDKICDLVSDAILDAILQKDPRARVACETYTTMGLVLVGGEITTGCYVEIKEVVKEVIKEIGYDKPEYGFDYRTCAILSAIHTQSPDIARGVDEKKKKGLGAGDQGMMAGYATSETPELMPLPILLAHRLVWRLSEVRKKKILSYLRPDGKSQIGVEYSDNQPKRIDYVILAAQHDPGVSLAQIKKDLFQKVIKPVCGPYLDRRTKYFINNTGRFVIGGPVSDTGMTGRKIIVDTYGGIGSHGGGCFSGKDPSKVDRSASYMARYIAKNIVAAGMTEKCEVKLAYVIGGHKPLSFDVNTFGTGKIAEDKIIKIINQNFDLSPSGMIKTLKLRRPIYKKTAAYGHFGRLEPEFTWEKTNKASLLRKLT